MENAIIEKTIATNNLPIENTSQTQIEISRAVQEVQAAVLVAQKMPRNEIKAYEKIMQAARRETLAKQSTYAYPRGGQIVKGASIRTAETLAKYWGNISFGIKELSQDNRNHTSEVMAYAWDLETNVREEKVFQVTHIRVAKGNKITLTDPRDIYEKVANDGARRLRACILGVLPSDIVEDFLAECEKTLLGDNKEPLIEKIRRTIKTFESIGVTQDMIEKRVGCKAEAMIPKQLLDLGAIYKSITDNFKSVDDFFGTDKKEVIEAENVLQLKQEDATNGKNTSKTK